MKFEMKKMLCFLFVAGLSIMGCTSSDIDSEIPVSSNDLIDQNVMYKSETVKVDVEEVKPPVAKKTVSKKNADVKVADVDDGVQIETQQTEDVAVIIPQPVDEYKSSESVTFVPGSYMKVDEKDDFEEAVLQAQERRGIKSVVKTEKESGKPEVEVAKKEFNKKLNVVEVEQPRSIKFLSTVVYHSNTKADISAKDMKALKNVVNFAKARDAIVNVVGNSSSRSKDMKEIQNKVANFDLSLLRAQKVRDALVKLGLPSDKIFISAVADTEKIMEENMPVNEAINRRTEIYINY